MTTSNSSIKLSRDIAVPAAEVFRALNNPTAFREWLSDGAHIDPREGGAFLLWWNKGYSTRGAIKAVEPEESLATTWFGGDEPSVSLVTFTIRANGANTLVTLEHSGLGSGGAWETARDHLNKLWTDGLENLQSVLETGDDLRISRRPMLGIFTNTMLSPDEAKRMGIEGVLGLRIDGALEEMGAGKAGLVKDTVLTKLDGVEMLSFNAFAEVVGKHRAGDIIPIEYYKDGKLVSTMMELSRRPLAEVPDDPKVLADTLRKLYTVADTRLAEVLAGVSDEQASKRPAEKEWNAKEVLAHLLDTEQDQHSWVGSIIQGDEMLWFSDNEHTRVKATVAAYGSAEALFAAYRRAQEETIQLLATLPPEVVSRKRSYVRIGRFYLNDQFHSDAHLDQIKTALAS